MSCEADIQVSGIAEDSSIVAGGSVLCKSGFVGHEKGMIEAKGDVNIGFVTGQAVRSHGNVTIDNKTMNATILSGKAIRLNGDPISAAV